MATSCASSPYLKTLTRSVAGSTSTRQKSLPNRALRSELFPAFTSPATTKRNGSFNPACKLWRVWTVSGEAWLSLARLLNANRAVPNSARSSR